MKGSSNTKSISHLQVAIRNRKKSRLNHKEIDWSITAGAVSQLKFPHHPSHDSNKGICLQVEYRTVPTWLVTPGIIRKLILGTLATSFSCSAACLPFPIPLKNDRYSGGDNRYYYSLQRECTTDIAFSTAIFQKMNLKYTDVHKSKNHHIFEESQHPKRHKITDPRSSANLRQDKYNVNCVQKHHSQIDEKQIKKNLKAEKNGIFHKKNNNLNHHAFHIRKYEHDSIPIIIKELKKKTANPEKVPQ